MTRCPLCGGRLRSDETQVGHEFSGRCSAHQVFSESDLAKADRVRSQNPRATGRTINRQAPEHGTRSRYVSPKYRCRCVPCRQASAEYQAERLRTNPEAREKLLVLQRDWKRRKAASVDRTR